MSIENSSQRQQTLDDTLTSYLTEHDWQAAVDRIQQDAQDPAAVVKERRRDTARYPRIMNCLLRVEFDGHVGIHLVRSRNISRGGLSLLHGGVVPAEADCLVVIESEAGQGRLLRANVVRCRAVKDDRLTQQAYEIGLQFAEPLDDASVVG